MSTEVLGGSVLSTKRLLSLTLGLPICAFAYNPVQAVASTAPACAGHPATIVVTARSPHTVWGTSHRDVIVVTVPGHVVNAGAGNDLICGSAGADRLNGGAGSDDILGGGGDDVLTGGSGDDVLDGQQGTDVEDGGSGADKVYDDGSDHVQSDEGDSVVGEQGDHGHGSDDQGGDDGLD
jgi:Ca2+-binding RTX toxin-like protein